QGACQGRFSIRRGPRFSVARSRSFVLSSWLIVFLVASENRQRVGAWLERECAVCGFVIYTTSEPTYSGQRLLNVGKKNSPQRPQRTRRVEKRMGLARRSRWIC